MIHIIRSLMGWLMLFLLIALPVILVHGLWVNDFSHLWKFIISDILLFFWCVFFGGTVLKVNKDEQ